MNVDIIDFLQDSQEVDPHHERSVGKLRLTKDTGSLRVSRARSSRVYPCGRVGLDNTDPSWLYLAMKHVRIAELKDRLSEHLRAVEGGGEVVVMDRNRPIARIVPIPSPGMRVRVLEPSRDFVEIRDRRRAKAGWSVHSTQLLLEERQDR